MATTTAIERKGRKLCRHRVCYTDPVSSMIAGRANQGITTKAIAKELGITIGQVQYAIIKAQHGMGVGVRFRSDYRNGKGPLARKMLQLTQRLALQMVSRKIAPKFIKFAAPGVPRLPT